MADYMEHLVDGRKVKRRKERGTNSSIAQVCTQIKLLQIEYGLGSH